MAGHNKWSKVKHIKARVDAIKGRVFSKCSHEISLAARDGGGDPSLNPRLRVAIDGAKAVSMPRENIERAVKKGTGELGGEAIQEVTYEAYGTGGVAFIVEMATDNVNRSAADVRSIFAKAGGAVASPGSVAYQFVRRGEIKIAASGLGAEELLEMAIEAGAADLGEDDEETGSHVLLTTPETLGTVANQLRELGTQVLDERLVSVPQRTILIEDLELANQAIRLFDQLDDYQDTRNVFTNFEVEDSLLEQLGD